MHHGYYGPDGRIPKERRQAQIDLIEELLNWAGVDAADHILDIGCGIGGSSLYLAEKYNAQVTGITLSPVQAARAGVRAATANLSHQVQFQVADALLLPFADASFDLVWSLESGEHMPDKARFMQEMCRVLKPGGKLLMATWCHRPILPSEEGLRLDEQLHLQAIYQVYCLPHVVALPDYSAIAQTLPLTDIQTADWSASVAPFWDEVITSALDWDVLWALLQAGWTTIQATLALGLMSTGYQRGLVRYGLLSGIKVSEATPKTP